MNYLAHAFLSGTDEDLLTGNLLGDFVKGRNYRNYPPKIAEGMVFHRKIDTYTDDHPVIHRAVKIFSAQGVNFGSIFTDMIFDHFLANDTEYFASEEDLSNYTQYIYAVIRKKDAYLNEEMRRYFRNMEFGNWLLNYYTKAGMERAIMGLCKRYPKLGPSADVVFCFMNEYENLKMCYHEFFPQLHAYANEIITSSHG